MPPERTRPLRARLAIGVFGGLFHQFACVAAASGLVHLPGKHGSVMLSGLPTLLIALASLSLFAASALYILDHHDRRPNEALYQAGRRFLGAQPLVAPGLVLHASGFFPCVAVWLSARMASRASRGRGIGGLPEAAEDRR